MKMEITIKTNNIPRNLLCWMDLTKKEQKEFDYLKTFEDKISAEFIRYKDWIYDLNQFENINHPNLKGWTGHSSDSFFSGVCIKMINNDQAIMGTYFC